MKSLGVSKLTATNKPSSQKGCSLADLEERHDDPG